MYEPTPIKNLYMLYRIIINTLNNLKIGIPVLIIAIIVFGFLIPIFG